MLRIFNDLKPFFEDNYKRIYVRQYAKLQNISPPTASKLLEKYYKEDILKKEEEKGYYLFFANKENNLFIELQRAYYLKKFEELIKHIEKELLNPVIILFGSFAKAEITEHSDMDLAIFTPSKRKIDLSKFESEFNRRIQVFIFKNKKQAEKNPELFNNILNGFKIGGTW